MQPIVVALTYRYDFCPVLDLDSVWLGCEGLFYNIAPSLGDPLK